MSRSAVATLIAFAPMLVGLVACMTPEQLRAADEAACTGYGFQRGTPDFAACLQRESLWRRYQTAYPAWYGPGGYGGGAFSPLGR